MARRKGVDEQMGGVHIAAHMFGWGGRRRGLAARSDDASSDGQVFLRTTPGPHHGLKNADLQAQIKFTPIQSNPS